MSIPVATKDELLNALTTTTMSLHTGFPGVLGSNEVTGGSPAYARLAVTFAASSGGTRTKSAASAFDVPASTIKWIGLWAGAAFKAAVPNGGATPRNFVAIPSTDLIQSPGHGYADTQKIVFFQGNPPTGLTEGTTYFVRDSATDNFKVTATSGGSVIDLTGASSFGCIVSAITEEVYAAQGVHTINTFTETIPD